MYLRVFPVLLSLTFLATQNWRYKILFHAAIQKNSMRCDKHP